MARPKKNVEVADADVAPVVADEKQPTSIECDEVELGYSRDEYEAIKLASENFGTYVAKFITPKYPNMYIAEVHKEDVAKQYLGWVPLKINMAKHTVEPAESKDEASRRSDVILCWKPMKRHLAEKQQWVEKQERFNRFVAAEGSGTQTNEFNQQIERLSHGQITAKPLAAKESDE